MVSEELVIGAGLLILAVLAFVVHTLLDLRNSVRRALSSMEDRLISLEDDARRLSGDAQALRRQVDEKTDASVLKRRLEGLASLLTTSHRRR